MTKILSIIAAWTLMTNAQQLDVQDLTNNNGYIPIKTGEVQTIDHYDKVLHFINLTTYEETIDLISTNIGNLKTATFEDNQLLNAVKGNFLLLKTRINNLHSFRREKRGLINVLGKGLKYIAGSMDSDDEKEITDAIEKIQNNEKTSNETMNKLILVNSLMTEHIKNITNHINSQQILISDYINKFKDYIQNKIQMIDDEVQFMQHIYRINNDVLLLNNHIEDIGRIIFSCKLGVIPTDILTQKEIDLITDFNSYSKIRVVVLFHDNNIILTLFIPQFSSNLLSRIIFEPLPNIFNKSIILNQYEILADDDNNIFDINVKDNLERNLVALKDKCITNILEFKEAQCELVEFEDFPVKEIVQGIIILKHFEGNIIHDCGRMKIKQNGTFLIKFENCKINVLNRTYTNVNMKVHDTFVLPNLITKIKQNNVTNHDFKLENLYLKQLEHENNIKILVHKSKNSNIISLGTDVAIIIIVIAFVIIIKHRKKWYNLSKPQIITGEKSGPFLQIMTPQIN